MNESNEKNGDSANEPCSFLDQVDRQHTMQELMEGDVKPFVRKFFIFITELTQKGSKIASWTEKGDKILVRDLKKFETLMDLNSISKSLGAFRKLLDDYGFEREKQNNGNDKRKFWHPLFRRDSTISELKQIARVKSMKKGSKQADEISSQNSKISDAPNHQDEASSQKIEAQLSIIVDRLDRIMDFLGMSHNHKNLNGSNFKTNPVTPTPHSVSSKELQKIEKGSPHYGINCNSAEIQPKTSQACFEMHAGDSSPKILTPGNLQNNCSHFATLANSQKDCSAKISYLHTIPSQEYPTQGIQSPEVILLGTVEAEICSKLQNDVLLNRIVLDDHDNDNNYEFSIINKGDDSKGDHSSGNSKGKERIKKIRKVDVGEHEYSSPFNPRNSDDEENSSGGTSSRHCHHHNKLPPASWRQTRGMMSKGADNVVKLVSDDYPSHPKDPILRHGDKDLSPMTRKTSEIRQYRRANMEFNASGRDPTNQDAPEHNLIGNFPSKQLDENCIIQISSYLPPKCLRSSLCVNKSWYSVGKSPQFRKALLSIPTDVTQYSQKYESSLSTKGDKWNPNDSPGQNGRKFNKGDSEIISDDIVYGLLSLRNISRNQDSKTPDKNLHRVGSEGENFEQYNKIKEECASSSKRKLTDTPKMVNKVQKIEDKNFTAVNADENANDHSSILGPVAKQWTMRDLSDGHVSTFVTKLYAFMMDVENKKNIHVASWNEKGDAILVEDIKKFDKLMIESSISKSRDAFRRLLNKYSFRTRMDRANNQMRFSHSQGLFRRDSTIFELKRIGRSSTKRFESEVPIAPVNERTLVKLPQLNTNKTNSLEDYSCSRIGDGKLSNDIPHNTDPPKTHPNYDSDDNHCYSGGIGRDDSEGDYPKPKISAKRKRKRAKKNHAEQGDYAG